MLFTLGGVLDQDAVQRIASVLSRQTWEDGRASARGMAAQVKRNLQLRAATNLPEEVVECQKMILAVLQNHHGFCTAVLPAQMTTPLFSKTVSGGGYGWHVDAPTMTNLHRTDVSVTLFLSNPEDYEGGELEIEGQAPIKLPAGSLVAYPSDQVHRVRDVEAGERIAAILWVQSYVRLEKDRTILKELLDLRAAIELGSVGSLDGIRVARIRNELLRRWMD